MIELVLPYPTSANDLWERTRTGMRKSDSYKKWLRDAGYLANAQHQRRIQGPYKLSLQAVRPDNKCRDIDNLIKGCSDLLVSIHLVDDDSLCEMVSARWVTTGDGITVRVEPAGVE